MKINRLKLSTTSCLGELWIDGVFFCYTLERPSVNTTGAELPLCIPTGTYEVTPRWSAHFKHAGVAGLEVLGINNVPGRTDIEVHPANWPTQLLGCVAVGDKQSQDYVGDSFNTFEKLMDKTKGQTLSVEVVE
ncbi:MAG TPA: DUF5675 family protein [Nitrosopumilaceae archaeon]|nr:DUF5675 family protein [Nitrosopumilaceae archaeon]